MLGAEEFPSEVRTVRGCLAGQRGGLLGPLTRAASRNGGLPAAAEKEPARGCAWAVRWGRVGAQLRSRLGGTTLMSRRAGNRLSPSPSPYVPLPPSRGGVQGLGPRGVPGRCSASPPEGLGSAQLGELRDLAWAVDLGQTLVGGPARVVPVVPGSHPCSEPWGWCLEALDCTAFGKGG